MTKPRYILEPYKGPDTRFQCPWCKHKEKTFSRYIDTETGEYVHPEVGRCNRENNCSYHYPPKQYFQDNKISPDNSRPTVHRSRTAAQQPRSVSFIPDEIFRASLKEYSANHFVMFLADRFGEEVTIERIKRYKIGTSNHWFGAVVFWQEDLRNRIRTGKIMLYDRKTGKRVKYHTNWAHDVLKKRNILNSDFQLVQCLFGEHLLLLEPDKNVCIVESEKTAIIASIYFPEYIWLACGTLNGLNAEKCRVLKGRRVCLVPDLKKGFEKWSRIAKELERDLKMRFPVYDLLEDIATEQQLEDGLDIADVLLDRDVQQFVQQGTDAAQPNRAVQSVEEAKNVDPLLQETADLDQRDEYLTAICSDLTDGEMHRRLSIQMGLNSATCREVAKLVCELTDAEIVHRFGSPESVMKSAKEWEGTFKRKCMET